MIRILAEDKSPLRLIAARDAETVEFHDRYGFVTTSALHHRQRQRAQAGAALAAGPARFSFAMRPSADGWQINAGHGCTIARADHGLWSLQSERGLFFLEDYIPEPLQLAPLPAIERSNRPAILLGGFLALMIALATLVSFLGPQEAEKKAQEQSEAPVVLHAPTPPPPQAAKEPTPAPPDPQAKSRKAVTQQLGFLGLLGKKNYNKAVGGLPTPTKQASPGAGPGGSEGSGGELVAGMGRGLHATTVGNTGMQGLGGLGTHGAGGGEGGYGDTSFGGQGGGKTLSAIPLAQDAKVDEGLDRAQIQATIMRYLSQVRACYEEGLKRNPALIGQLTMAFEVGPQGQMNFAHVQRSSLSDRPVEDCVQLKMMNWKFPQPRGGKPVKVTYPFMLRPVRS